MIFSILFFCACGGGGGGGGGLPEVEEEKPPIANAGPDQIIIEGTIVTLDASSSIDKDGTVVSYSWQQIDGPSVALSSASDIKPNFTAPDVEPVGITLEFKLTVIDDKGLQSSDTCTVTVKRNPKYLTEDVLYTVFAGSANDGVTFPLYEIMVNGFINMSMSFVSDILGEVDLSNPFGTHEYTITKDEYTAVLTLTVPVDLIFPVKFEGILNVDFKNTGYQPASGICTYKGTNSGDELEIEINGYVDYIDSEYYPYIRTLNITGTNQLQALYGTKTAKYNNWNIAMNIFYGSDDPYAGKEDPITEKTVSNSKTVNYSFLSGSMENETRDYTVGGSFILDEGTYTFNSGFKYIQSLDSKGDLLLTSANGKIKVPGMNSAATIKSSFSVSNPTGNKTIASADDSYLWDSGQMTITGSSGSIVAAFDDGTVNFSGDLGSWSLAGWQLLLDPLK